MEAARRYYRMVYATPAQLIQGDDSWDSKLLDLSLQGAMVEIPQNWNGQENEDYHLRFSLAESDVVIEMDVTLKKIHASKGLGLQCHHIDIDSATHLKRMIELNVGDDEELHRELELLIVDHEAMPS